MTDTTTTTAAPQHSRLSRLYTGTGAFEIVGRRKRWYIVTAVIVLIALLSMLLRGFSWGIDFEGGTRIQMPAVPGVSVEDVETVFSDTPAALATSFMVTAIMAPSCGCAGFCDTSLQKTARVRQPAATKEERSALRLLGRSLGGLLAGAHLDQGLRIHDVRD